MSGREKIPYRTWSGDSIGLLENRVSPGVGYEVPKDFGAWGQEQGELYGAARVPLDLALEDDSGVNQFVDGGVGVRKMLAAEQAAKASIPARKLVGSEEARKELIAVRVEAAKDELPLLVGKEDETRAKVAETEQNLEEAKEQRDRLGFSERGLIGSKWTLIAVEASAVAFDIAVLHGALEFSGMGPVSVWMTSLLAPAALAGVHFTFGTVLGAIIRKLPGSQRLRAAVGGLAFGLVALLVTFVTLAVFREAGTEALNAGLAEIASGDESGELNLFISSLWLGPLQIAASCAAIAAAALWVLGRPGRDLDLKVHEATAEHAVATRDLSGASGKVDQVRQVVRDGQPQIHQVSVEAREAEAANEGEKSALELRLAAEDALGHAVKGRFKAALVATDRIYANGQVRRAAMGDEERRGRKVIRRSSRDVSESSLADQTANGSDSDNNRAGGRSARRWFK